MVLLPVLYFCHQGNKTQSSHKGQYINALCFFETLSLRDISVVHFQ